MVVFYVFSIVQMVPNRAKHYICLDIFIIEIYQYFKLCGFLVYLNEISKALGKIMVGHVIHFNQVIPLYSKQVANVH